MRSYLLSCKLQDLENWANNKNPFPHILLQQEIPCNTDKNNNARSNQEAKANNDIDDELNQVIEMSKKTAKLDFQRHNINPRDMDIETSQRNIDTAIAALNNKNASFDVNTILCGMRKQDADSVFLPIILHVLFHIPSFTNPI